MTTGMLWFDNSTSPLSAKIKKAVDYYQKKYGLQPDLCLVHPSALSNAQMDMETIVVRPYRPVLPGHIWIGIEDKS